MFCKDWLDILLEDNRALRRRWQGGGIRGAHPKRRDYGNDLQSRYGPFAPERETRMVNGVKHFNI
jgi:hypothetical protein